MARKKKRKPRLPASFMKLGGLLAAEGIRAWMSTLDYRAVFYDRSVDPVFGVDTPRIYIFWHENILIPLYLRGHCNLAMLLSQHNDADILARVAYHLGFDCVRGSTYRGGARAIWELFERSRRQHLTITPDGRRLYVTSRDTNTVIAIDTLTEKIIAEIPVGKDPHGIAVLPVSHH